MNGRPFGCKPNALTAELSAPDLSHRTGRGKQGQRSPRDGTSKVSNFTSTREMAFFVPRVSRKLHRALRVCTSATKWTSSKACSSSVFRGEAKIWLEIGSSCDAIIAVIIRCELGRSFRVGVVRLFTSVCIWIRRGSQVVRQRSAKPLSSVRFRPAPPIFPQYRDTPLLLLTFTSKAGIASEQ